MTFSDDMAEVLEAIEILRYLPEDEQERRTVAIQARLDQLSTGARLDAERHSRVSAAYNIHAAITRRSLVGQVVLSTVGLVAMVVAVIGGLYSAFFSGPSLLLWVAIYLSGSTLAWASFKISDFIISRSKVRLHKIKEENKGL